MRIRTLHLTRPNGASLLGPLDLDVAPGELLAIVGESGSGKSLLLQAILGALGREIRQSGHVTDPSASMAWVPQNPLTALHPLLSVADQVSLLASVRLGWSRSLALAEALPWMERVGLEPSRAFLARRPSQLSGGERQRVALIQALLARPDQLLLDEPTSALDPALTRKVEGLLRSLEPAPGWLWVTHDLAQAERMANRILVLYGGCPMELHPASDPGIHPYTRRLLRAADGLPDPDRGFLAAPGARGCGCPFAARCTEAVDRCFSLSPPWEGTPISGQACWHHTGGAGGENRLRPAALAR